MKIYQKILSEIYLKILSFLEMKCFIYLNRRVFLMDINWGITAVFFLFGVLF